MRHCFRRTGAREFQYVSPLSLSRPAGHGGPHVRASGSRASADAREVHKNLPVFCASPGWQRAPPPGGALLVTYLSLSNAHLAGTRRRARARIRIDTLHDDSARARAPASIAHATSQLIPPALIEHESALTGPIPLARKAARSARRSPSFAVNQSRPFDVSRVPRILNLGGGWAGCAAPVTRRRFRKTNAPPSGRA